MPAWLTEIAGDALLRVHVQPGAKQTGIAGLHGTALKIRLAAPPVDGRANECLIAFIAAVLGVAKNRVTLLSGAGARDKRVRIAAVSAAVAEATIAPQLKAPS